MTRQRSVSMMKMRRNATAITAVVIASNSGDAGPATRDLWPHLVQQFAQRYATPPRDLYSLAA